MLPFCGLTGGNIVLLELANRLAGRGHRVWMIFPHADAPWWKPRRYLRVKARDARLRPWIDWFHLRVPVVRCPRLEDDCVPDADVVLVSHWRDVPAVAALAATKGRKFYYVQGYETDFLHDPDERAAADATYRLPLEHVVPSSWLGRLMRDRFGRASLKIGYGLDFARFPLPASRAFREPPRCLMQHHDLETKGLADGLRAFAIARRELPDLTLSLFGARSNDVATADRRLGFVLPADVGRVYLDHDVFIWPSRREGYGLPPVEAMACRCAVLTTDNGGSEEFAVSGETALVSPPCDVDALAANIVRVARDRELRRRLADNGCATIRRTMTWEPVLDAWEHAFAGRASAAEPPA